MLRWIVVASAFACCSSGALAIAPGTVDTFSDGTTMNWGGDADENVSTGGPAGADDRFLRGGSGTFGIHSKLAIYNSDCRWIGNYTAAGVTQIEADIMVIAVSPPGPLQMRAVLFGSTGRVTSTNSISVSADGQWHHLTFSVAPSDLTVVVGGGSVASVLADVSRVMIRHQSAAPASGGTIVSANVGFDNMKSGPGSAPPPVTITQWRSIRTHQVAGDLVIVLDPAASGNGMSGPTTEPRQGGIQKIQVDFSGPTDVCQSAVSVIGHTLVDGDSGYFPTTMFMVDADTLEIDFDPGVLPDLTCFTIDLSPSGVIGLTGDHDVDVRSLAGDITGSGLVNLSDAIAAKARIGQSVASNVGFDIDLDGSITNLDALAAKGQLGDHTVCP